jgi:preprotein translocase subunit SecE
MPVSKTVDGSSNLSIRALIKAKTMKQYVIESYQELKNKVTWPTWTQLQSSSILVAISSVIIALIIGLMDVGFDTILGEFYKIF